MHESELSYYTTKELIAELMRRQTFLGVVVHAAEEERGQAWADERPFHVHFNSNLDTMEASRLLDSVASYMFVHEA
jgi:hypothetical protein